MRKISSIEEALNTFIDASIAHELATDKGDYKTCNKSYSIIVKAAQFLKEHNSREELTQLLTHSSLGVQLWSALYLLPIKEKEAVQIIESIANGSTKMSLDAKMTLSEWYKGNLKSVY